MCGNTNIDIEKCDPNLKILIEAQASKVLIIKSISSIDTDVLNKNVYKIIFEDHTLIKGRTYTNEFHAKKVYELSNYLKDLNVSKPLAILGKSMLLEWIKGYSPRPGELNLNQVGACGKLMAHIHLTPLPKITKNKYKHLALNDNGDNDDMNRFIFDQIELLNSLNMLTKPEGDKLKEIILDNYIGDIKLTLVCGDLCRENLVINKYNDLFLVDTENLTIDTIEYDLARSLYRWPMNKNERTAFINGYMSATGYFEFNDSFIYWMIRVLVKSAVFRSNIRNIDVSYKMLPIINLKMIMDHNTNSFSNFIDFELVRN